MRAPRPTNAPKNKPANRLKALYTTTSIPFNQSDNPQDDVQAENRATGPALSAPERLGAYRHDNYGSYIETYRQFAGLDTAAEAANVNRFRR